MIDVWILTFLLPSSDFENKFVCGEIMTFDDLKEHGSESAVKAVRKDRVFTSDQWLTSFGIRLANTDNKESRMRWWMVI